MGWLCKGSNKKPAANKDTKFLAMMTDLEQLKRAIETAGVNLTPKTKTRDTEKGLGARLLQKNTVVVHAQKTYISHNYADIIG
eukprot:12619747-Ditylum_brightwellii.AAC.2